MGQVCAKVTTSEEDQLKNRNRKTSAVQKQQQQGAALQSTTTASAVPASSNSNSGSSNPHIEPLGATASANNKSANNGGESAPTGVVLAKFNPLYNEDAFTEEPTAHHQGRGPLPPPPMTGGKVQNSLVPPFTTTSGKELVSPSASHSLGCMMLPTNLTPCKKGKESNEGSVGEDARTKKLGSPPSPARPGAPVHLPVPNSQKPDSTAQVGGGGGNFQCEESEDFADFCSVPVSSQ